MIQNETTVHFEKIAKFLEQKKLKDAFDTLALLLSNTQNWKLKEKLNELEETYKIMLDYLTEGFQDPDRQRIYNDLLRSVYQLADSVALEIKTKVDSAFFYERRRIYLYGTQESSLQLVSALEEITGKLALLSLLEEEEKNNDWIDLEKQRETISQKIFYSVWLSDLWNLDAREKWSELLNNPLNSLRLSSLIITALTLNLLESFDEQKALLLLEAAENKNEEIRQRALTGIILFLRKYDKRLYLYTSIHNRIQHLAEQESFIRAISHIILQFIYSRETEKITRQITEELIPEMMKIGPKLSNKLLTEDWMSEADLEDRNPEWQDLIKEAGLEDKLQELSEMQLEGADVMHSSFIHLKNYAFFNEMCNWFLPFETPANFMNNKEMMKFSKVLTDSKMMCNSDKYSFYFTVMQMPENYRKMTFGQLSAESSSVQEILDAESVNRHNRIHPVARQYIQDLYRFYKLHPRRKDFEDIFEMKPEFYKAHSINQLIGENKENMLIVGEFYFNRNYFEEAADIYDSLLKDDPNNYMLYEKWGYCLQMLGDLEGALETYLKAELWNPANPWLIKKLSYCYRMLKQPEKALIYYKKVEKLNPDNLSVQLNIGHCHLELKNYDEALKSYFKVEYLEKNKQKAWRPIAWCSFLIGKYEQAMDYFHKIMAENPNATDYLNAGHTQLALKNNKEAIHFYCLSFKHPDNSLEKFMESFRNDLPDLIHAGIDRQDLPFILDRIMYGK